jgi:putative FmdB family regulatory protein
MPIYTFKCSTCQKEFDEFTHNNNIEKIECICEKKQIAEKIFASTSKPIFKGSGFYETDYKKSK